MAIVRKGFALTLLFSFAVSMALIAQPSPAELASEIESKNQDRLTGIDNLEMTVKMMVGDSEMDETTTRYITTTRDGRKILVVDTEDEFYEDNEMIEGMFDGSFEELVRGAESVENDRVDGRAAYKLVIRDRELLNDLQESEFDADEADIEINYATLWIDSDMLVPVKMRYSKDEDESGLVIEIRMEDYETYSGLPIARKMTIEMEGIDTMFTEEEIVEARQAMQEMREQLDQMPRAQREMIEEQMAGQMEQFEQILESGGAGSTTMMVTDVRVNQ